MKNFVQTFINSLQTYSEIFERACVCMGVCVGVCVCRCVCVGVCV
jgi:hypothetical protein